MEEGDLNCDSQSHSSPEEDIELYIDDKTLNSIIKFQALVRGYLTRKLVFEHLQRMAEQNGFEMVAEDENDTVLRASDINRFNQDMISGDLIAVKEVEGDEEEGSTGSI